MLPEMKNPVMERLTESRTGERAALALPFILIFLSMLSTTLLVPFQREIVETHGTDPSAKALFVSLTMLGLFVASPLAGVLADRFSTRLQLPCFALLNALCFLWIWSAESMTSLLAARFSEGVTFAFVIGPLLARAGGHDDRGARMAAAGLLLALGAALGMPLGGLFSSHSQTLLAGACLMVTVGIMGLFLRGTAALRRKTSPGELLLRVPLFLVPVGFAFFDRFIAGFLVGPFSWRLRTDLALGPADVGRLLGSVMLPMVILAIPAAALARRVGPLALVSAGSALYGICIGLAAVSSSLSSITPLLLLAGLGAGMLYAPSMILTSSMAPPELRATAMSLYVGAGSFGFMLGPILPAQAMQITGGADVMRGTALLIASLAVVTSALAFLFRKRLSPAPVSIPAERD